MKQPEMWVSCIPLLLGITVIGLAAERGFTSWPAAKPILDDQHGGLPAELQNADEGRWNAWTRRQDIAIRARLEQGNLDSMVNLLLFGTSFTKQPRIGIQKLTEAAKNGTLRSRVDDLVAGLRNPGNNERLKFLGDVLRRKGIDPGGVTPDICVFIYA